MNLYTTTAESGLAIDDSKQLMEKHLKYYSVQEICFEVGNDSKYPKMVGRYHQSTAGTASDMFRVVKPHARIRVGVETRVSPYR